MVKKNPWLNIWIHPRDTIRKIVAENSNKGLWILAIIYGFSSLLGMFQSVSLGTHLGAISIFLIALVMSPIWGYLFFSIWAWIIYWTGRLFKGEGTIKDVRATVAWASVPTIVSDLVWIMSMMMFGAALFVTPDGLNNQLAQNSTYLLLAFALIKVVMSVWTLVIGISALAEVQGFSILRAIGNIILGCIFTLIIAAIVSLIFILIMGSLEPRTAAIFINL